MFRFRMILKKIFCIVILFLITDCFLPNTAVRTKRGHTTESECEQQQPALESNCISANQVQQNELIGLFEFSLVNSTNFYNRSSVKFYFGLPEFHFRV
jgi:hypothetical protein